MRKNKQMFAAKPDMCSTTYKAFDQYFMPPVDVLAGSIPLLALGIFIGTIKGIFRI